MSSKPDLDLQARKVLYMSAMKAEAVPAGWQGLWHVVKGNVVEPLPTARHEKIVVVPPGLYTFLYRLTDSTLHRDPPGEVVMEDTPFELSTHLGFVMRAHGRVLITGLGLGCVIRGLLENPDVTEIVCIENSKDVLALVAPSMPTARLTIVEADALEWSSKNKEAFDCAWHDVWTNQDEGEPHLDQWHLRLIMNLHKSVAQQGAWAFDRRLKKMLPKKYGIHWIG